MTKKTFVWRKKDGETSYDGGFEPTDILVQHYNDPGFRTMLLDEAEFTHLKPWKLCALLNEAYDSGRRDAMEDLRNFIGIK
jgi:hypothetical protein